MERLKIHIYPFRFSDRNGSLSPACEQVGLIRMLWLQEKESRLAAEEKVILVLHVCPSNYYQQNQVTTNSLLLPVCSVPWVRRRGEYMLDPQGCTTGQHLLKESAVYVIILVLMWAVSGIPEPLCVQ